MNHCLISIFDASNATGDEYDEIESAFINLNIPDNFKIFYLKLEKLDHKSGDRLCRIIPNATSPIETDSEGYNFSNFKSLKCAIQKIIEQTDSDTRLYLVLSGHSSIHGLFKRKYSDHEIYSIVPNCSLTTGYQQDFQIIWPLELSMAFEGIKFEITIFNDCVIASFSNCRFLQTFTKYCIATENYMSMEMLGFRTMLERLFRESKGNEGENLALLIFDQQLNNALNYLYFTTLNLKSTSLFLFNLTEFQATSDLFDSISRKIFLGLPWLSDAITVARNSVNEVFGDSQLVDMYSFFISLSLQDGLDRQIVLEIKELLFSLDEIVISKWCRNNKPTNFCGFPLFFPAFVRNSFYFEMYKFSRNFICTMDSNAPYHWDKVLDFFFDKPIKQ